MAYEFDPVNKYILIPPGEILTIMQDVYDEAMDWADSDEGMVHDLPIEAIGKAEIGADVFTDTIYKLLNGWKLKYVGGSGSPSWDDGGFGVKEGELSQAGVTTWQPPVINTGNGAVTSDYINAKTPPGRGSRFTIQDSTGVLLSHFETVPTDMSVYTNVSTWVWVDEDSIANYEDLHFHFGSDNDNVATFHMEYYVAIDHLVEGWNKLRMPIDQFVSHGGDSFSNLMTNVAIYFETKSGGGAFVTFSGLYLEDESTPTVCLVFRDAREGALNEALPILNAAGYKAAAYVDKDQVGTGVYLDSTGLVTLHANGWDLYPTSHNTLIDSPIDYIRSSVDEQHDYLMTLGIMNHPSVYMSSSEGLTARISRNIDDLFSAAVDAPHEGFNEFPPPERYHFQMFRINRSIHDNAYVDNLIRSTIDSRQNIILGIRDVGGVHSDNYTVQEFQNLVDSLVAYDATSDLEISILTDLMDRIGAYQATIVGTTIVDDPDTYGANRTVQPDEGSVEITFEVTSSATIIDQDTLITNTTETNRYAKLIPATV